MATDKKKKKKKKEDSTDQTVITSITKVAGQKPKRPYLMFLAGPLLGKLFPLNEGISILGRSPDIEIVINDSRISRQHLEITVDGETVVLKDLGSTNGTFVNGEKVEEHVLHEDDKIQISPATIFKFSLADEDEKIALDELYELGVLDPLTSVYNKRSLVDRLKEELSHSRRAKIDLSIMMIDIDYFKKINDTYGHLAGDHVLVKLSKTLQAMTRHEDIVARYGGEEFAVILRDTNEEGAHLLAERIRTAVEGARHKFEGEEIRVTISIGIASLSKKDGFETYEEIISAADKGLYYSKEHGRNRTTTYSQIK
jgi:diguanylate cyclase (GGDEF)-like protein